MDIDKKTPYGGIGISINAIASLAGSAAGECYGVVGLAPRPSLKNYVAKILEREDFDKGIYVTKLKKGYEISVYLYCAYYVKLSEVASEVQKKVKYELEKAFSIPFPVVNVYVQDLKELES